MFAIGKVMYVKYMKVRASWGGRKYLKTKYIHAGEDTDAPKGNHGENKQQGYRTGNTTCDHSDEGGKRVRSVGAMNQSPDFQPSAPNPLHAHIEALAAAAPRLMEDAPPDFRLLAVSYQMAALLDQLRDEARNRLIVEKIVLDAPMNPSTASLFSSE